MASKQDSTGGTTPAKGEAEQAVAGVGGVRSSDDSALDLWWSGQPAEERRDATCSAGEKRREGRLARDTLPPLVPCAAASVVTAREG
jgi:hypothetical protein